MFWFTAICVLAETCALMTRRGSRKGAVRAPGAVAGAQRRSRPRRRAGGLRGASSACCRPPVGRWEEAAAHLESAIAKNEACGNPAGASIVRRDLAKLLLARRAEGDLDRAAELLRGPLRAAQETRHRIAGLADPGRDRGGRARAASARPIGRPIAGDVSRAPGATPTADPRDEGRRRDRTLTRCHPGARRPRGLKRRRPRARPAEQAAAARQAQAAGRRGLPPHHPLRGDVGPDGGEGARG